MWMVLTGLALAGCGGGPVTRSEALRNHGAGGASRPILLFFHASSGSTRTSERARAEMASPAAQEFVARNFDFVPIDTGRWRPFEIWAAHVAERNLVEYFQDRGVRNATIVVAYRATPPLLVLTNAEGEILARYEFSGSLGDLMKWLHLHAGITSR